MLTMLQVFSLFPRRTISTEVDKPDIKDVLQQCLSEFRMEYNLQLDTRKEIERIIDTSISREMKRIRERGIEGIEGIERIIGASTSREMERMIYTSTISREMKVTKEEKFILFHYKVMLCKWLGNRLGYREKSEKLFDPFLSKDVDTLTTSELTRLDSIIKKFYGRNILSRIDKVLHNNSRITEFKGSRYEFQPTTEYRKLLEKELQERLIEELEELDSLKRKVVCNLYGYKYQKNENNEEEYYLFDAAAKFFYDRGLYEDVSEKMLSMVNCKNLDNFICAYFGLDVVKQLNQSLNSFFMIVDQINKEGKKKIVNKITKEIVAEAEKIVRMSMVNKPETELATTSNDESTTTKMDDISISSVGKDISRNSSYHK